MGIRNRDRRRAKKQRRSQDSRGRSKPFGGPPFSFGERMVGPDQVAQVIMEAAQERHHHNPHYDATLELLVNGPAVSDGQKMVDHELASRLEDSLGLLWRSGWQPVDLVGVVGRKLGLGHRKVVVAAIRSESRRYASSTVSARWRRQLDSLEEPAPDSLPGFVAVPWVLWGGPSRAEAIDVAVDLLALMWHLPALPLLCEPPGSPGASDAAGGDAVTDDRVLATVRALLSKAESTEFGEEAEAFTAKAQELMSRHAIDRAVIDAKGSGAKPRGRRVPIDDPYAEARALLLAEVAEANRCRAVWSKQLGFTTLFGFEVDLQAAEVLYTSLLLQATSALSVAGRAMGAVARKPGYRRSFLVGFGLRIGARLREARANAQDMAKAQHGSALLPVLARRRSEVDSACDQAFPEMTTFSPAANDDAGWAAGQAAADVATLWAEEELVAAQVRSA